MVFGLPMRVYDYFVKSERTNDVAIIAGTSVSLVFHAGALFSQQLGYTQLVVPSIWIGLSGGIVAFLGISYKLRDGYLRPNEMPVIDVQLSKEYIEKCIQFLARDHTEFWTQKFQGERNQKDFCNANLEFVYAFGLGLLKVLDVKKNDNKIISNMTECDNNLRYSKLILIFESIDKDFVMSIQAEISNYLGDFEVDVSLNPHRNLLYCRIIHVLEKFLPKYQAEYKKWKSRWSGNLENIESLDVSGRKDYFKNSHLDYNPGCSKCFDIKIWFEKFKYECENQIASFDNLKFYSEKIIEKFKKLIESADVLGEVVLKLEIEEASREETVQESDSKHSVCSVNHAQVFQLLRLEVREIRSKLNDILQTLLLQQSKPVASTSYLLREKNTEDSSSLGSENTLMKNACAALCEEDGKAFCFEENEKMYLINEMYRQQKALDLNKICHKKLVKELAKTKEFVKSGGNKDENLSGIEVLNKCHKDPTQEIPMSEENLTYALKYLANNFVESLDKMSNNQIAGDLKLEDIPFALTFAFTYGLKTAIDLRLGAKLEKVCKLNGEKHFKVKHFSEASQALKTIDDNLCEEMKLVLDNFHKISSKVDESDRSLLICEVLYGVKKFHKLYQNYIDLYNHSEDFVVDAASFQSEDEDPGQRNPNDPELAFVPVNPMEKIVEQAKVLETIKEIEKEYNENSNSKLSKIVNEQNSKKKVSFSVNVKEVKENEQSDLPSDFEIITEAD